MNDRTLDECNDINRHVKTETRDGVRLQSSEEQMGFSFHITTIYAGSTTDNSYKNHLQSLFCFSGNGEGGTLDDGRVYEIEPGTIYVLDKNDRHVLRGGTERDPGRGPVRPTDRHF